MDKRISFLTLTYLLFFSFVRLSVPPVEAVSGTIRVPQNFQTIQEAIDASPPGGIIEVASGTYHENVTVWKPLTIRGENKESTTIDQPGAFAIFHVTADNVTITGFTIRSASIGIWIDGFDHNTITSDVITNNDDGIWVISSHSNAINNNNITNNVFRGLYLETSNDTTSNGNTITKNTYGIHMEQCKNGLIYDNIISLNDGDGVHGIHSHNNAIFLNMISNNSFGIYLEGSNVNSICKNNLLNNVNQAWAEDTTINTWDDGSKGNYWSDYNGTDTDQDEIGDTPYVINENNTDHYPLMSPIVFHDIAITNVSASKTVVGQGFPVNINVNAQNQGKFTETFNITAYTNTTAIATNITLTSGNSTTVTFVWNTTGVAKGNHTIRAEATQLPDETDLGDNTLEDGWIVVTLVGDINADWKVDIEDVFSIALCYGTSVGQPGYDPNLDVNGDEKTDIEDIFTAAIHYGETDP